MLPACASVPTWEGLWWQRNDPSGSTAPKSELSELSVAASKCNASFKQRAVTRRTDESAMTVYRFLFNVACPN
eukprot:6427068-Amphidinium_carterae.1